MILRFVIITASIAIITAALSFVTTNRLRHLNHNNLSAMQAQINSRDSAETDAKNSQAEIKSLKKELASAQLRIKTEMTTRENLRKKLLDVQRELAEANRQLGELKAGNGDPISTGNTPDSTETEPPGSTIMPEAGPIDTTIPESPAVPSTDVNVQPGSGSTQIFPDDATPSNTGTGKVFSGGVGVTGSTAASSGGASTAPE